MTTYNPQKTPGKPYKQTAGKAGISINGSGKRDIAGHETISDGRRFPKTDLYFARETGLHPTQKPVALFEYLIRTHSNEGDTVLDNCMGSGTTGVACGNTNRRFIGIEQDETIFAGAERRIKEADAKRESRTGLFA